MNIVTGYPLEKWKHGNGKDRGIIQKIQNKFCLVSAAVVIVFAENIAGDPAPPKGNKNPHAGHGCLQHMIWNFIGKRVMDRQSNGHINVFTFFHIFIFFHASGFEHKTGKKSML